MQVRWSHNFCSLLRVRENVDKYFDHKLNAREDDSWIPISALGFALAESLASK
jgi:hypothetical protein